MRYGLPGGFVTLGEFIVTAIRFSCDVGPSTRQPGKYGGGILGATWLAVPTSEETGGVVRTQGSHNRQIAVGFPGGCADITQNRKTSTTLVIAVTVTTVDWRSLWPSETAGSTLTPNPSPTIA